MNQLIIFFAAINFLIGLLVTIFSGNIMKTFKTMLEGLWGTQPQNKSINKIVTNVDYSKGKKIQRTVGVIIMGYSIFLLILGLIW